MTTETPTRSRRSILAAAAGAAAGAFAATFGRPLSAQATVATMQTGTDNASDAPTRLIDSAPGVVLGVTTTTMPAYEIGHEVVAIGTDNIAYPALNVVSTNDDEGLAVKVSALGTYATGVRVEASQNGVTAAVHNEFGAGLYGTAEGPSAAGVKGHGLGPGTVGVAGNCISGAGIAVGGWALGTGTGGKFSSETGSALMVDGRARFSRSGRALVPKNSSHVDVTVPGGLSSSTSTVLATIQTYRSGVSVAGVRLNYPTTGKARIYLTKVASTTTTTPVGWFVVG